jgi:hypothetical protein
LATVVDLNPFFEMYVKNDPRNGAMVIWGLRREFDDPGPYTYKMQWAETADADNWLDLDVGPLVDTYFAIDPHERAFSFDHESYYRLILTTGSNPYEGYVSPAVAADGTWAKRDWLKARDICRKERLLISKYTGISGQLLKRRIWGPKCPRCADFDTDEPSQVKCLICYGTGIQGGYWPSDSFIMDMTGKLPRFKTLDDNKGLDEQPVMSVRLFGYPDVGTNDLFKEDGSGKIWSFGTLENIANVKGIVIVQQGEARELPFTDVAYDWPNTEPVPVPPTPVESASLTEEKSYF